MPSSPINQCSTDHFFPQTGATIANIHFPTTCIFLDLFAVGNFWLSVFDTHKEALNTNIDPGPLLFGVSSRHALIAQVRKVFPFTSIPARGAILLKWKHASPPSHDRWIHDIFDCVRLKKLRRSLSSSLKSFSKTF